MKNKLIKSNGYARLLDNIKKELNALEFLLRTKTAQTYHKVGGYISEDILENEERADYGDYLIVRLANDSGIDKTTLWRAVQFNREYPILDHGRELSWRHYRALLAIKDKGLRKELEEKAISKGWKSEELRQYIKNLRQREIKSKQKSEEIPRLSFTRGKLHIYKLIESGSKIAVDLGFKMWQKFEGKGKEAGDYIEAATEDKISISQDSIFTYVAKVEKIIDGDTIEVVIDCDFKMETCQTLRLRGIDCPEIDTPEGQRAKKFVEGRLKDLEFIIVKTYKDRDDKYGRYLTDIFYPLLELRRTGQKGETDPQRVADTGNFLNQELLNAGLAKKV